MPDTSDAFLGEIMLFAGTFAPRGWLDCNGALLSIAQYDALFTILGTTYGGDGVTTFGLPDLRGRCIHGAGQGPGLGNRSLGELSGTEAVTLLAANLPAHTHSMLAANGASDASTPTQRLASVSEANSKVYVQPGGSLAELSAQAVSSVGGSAPHTNMQPSLALRYCICVEGFYPSRS